jgi:hypothetical protein
MPNPKNMACSSFPAAVTEVAPLGVAAVLLAARVLGGPLGLELPGVSKILSATGTGRSRAYELSRKVVGFSRQLEQPVGRPRAAARPPEPEAGGEPIAREVLRFVMGHPGSVHGHDERRHYADAFRRFVVALRSKHSEVPLERFAACVEVPLGTLKAWLLGVWPETAARVDVDEQHDSPESAERPSTSSIPCANIETVLEAYARWHGGFGDFCDHVQRELGIRWGRDTLSRLLEVEGARRVHRRPGRSPDELATRGAFQTFFPGAQWVGDGKAVLVTIDGTPHHLNFELQCDTFSGAFVGLSIRDEEDSAAVIESFADGVATTGAPPLAELLDNKPSNHTEAVAEALGDTLSLRATPGRPQNKAHVEGGFGLFAQTTPPLELHLVGASPRQIATQLLGLVTTTWARAQNHRSRHDRGGRSRAELYASASPSDEQIAQARAAFEERRRHQDLARQTLEARQRPDVRLFLDQAFERLALLDPERHIRLAIARYPFDAIAAAVSIFESKQHRGSLPSGVDARYLLGIVKNVQEQTEGELFAEILLRNRKRARDLILSRLEGERDALFGQDRLPDEVLAELVDRALLTEGTLEPTFWLETLAGFMLQAPPDQREDRFLAAAQYIRATFRSDPRRRQNAVRFLAERLVPLT